MEMADQSEASDKPSKNGFLEKKAQETLEESQRRMVEIAKSLPIPDRTRYGRDTPYLGNPLSKTVDSGDGYAETIQKHWQEA
jgi:hypothetical protein